jgi:hypothetical protein
VVGIKLAVEGKPFGRISIPGRLGKKKTTKHVCSEPERSVIIRMASIPLGNGDRRKGQKEHRRIARIPKRRGGHFLFPRLPQKEKRLWKGRGQLPRSPCRHA